MLLAALALLVSACHGAYYLPGISPNTYQQGDSITLKANKVTSTKNPVQYDYYDLPFCRKAKTKASFDNLGERLTGDVLTATPYEIGIKEDSSCKILCRKVNKKHDIHLLNEVIDQEYRIHWMLDGLPVGVRSESNVVYRGYPVGFTVDNPPSADPKHAKRLQKYIYNHVKIIVRYSEKPEEFKGVRVVGFEVVPISIKHQYEGTFEKDKTVVSTCNPAATLTNNPDTLQPLGSSVEM